VQVCSANPETDTKASQALRLKGVVDSMVSVLVEGQMKGVLPNKVTPAVAGEVRNPFE
jgi:hypothetical protein